MSLGGWEDGVCVQAGTGDGGFDAGNQGILSTLPIPCAVTAMDTAQTCDLSAVGRCILKEKTFCQTA